MISIVKGKTEISFHYQVRSNFPMILTYRSTSEGAEYSSGRYGAAEIVDITILGRLKGLTSMRLFSQFAHLKKKPYWGNHFLTKGYCVYTVCFGCGHDTIRKYVRYQERQLEHLMLFQ